MRRTEKTKLKKRKRMRRIGIFILILAGLYCAGAFYFEGHFFPGTTVGNQDISFLTLEDAEQDLKSSLSEYKLTVLESEENPQNDEVITTKDAGFSYTNLSFLSKILDRQPYETWILHCTKEHKYKDLKVQVDEAKLSSHIDGMACMNPKKPVESENAKVVYNKKKKTYRIRKESIGNIVDKEAFLKAATDAFLNQEPSISLVEKTYYKQPAYTSESEKVKKAKKKMNSYLKGTVTYKDGELTLKLGKSKLHEFIKCSDKYKVTLKKDKIKKYVENEVADKFNSIDGDIPDGLTAWRIDEEEELDKLVSNIKSGKATTRKPIYSQEGLDRNESFIESTFIDVSLSNQEMWYVENNKVVFSSPVVTGNLSTGHGTATGIYRIEFKQRDHLMVKYNSFVHYWMPYNTSVGIGFHDANWRSSFGGQIYRTNGSHGCVNMPPAKAQELFYMINTGDQVYIHW